MSTICTIFVKQSFLFVSKPFSKKKIMIILLKEHFSKEFYNTNVTEDLINNVNIVKSKYHFLRLIYRFIICIGPFVFEKRLCKKILFSFIKIYLNAKPKRSKEQFRIK